MDHIFTMASLSAACIAALLIVFFQGVAPFDSIFGLRATSPEPQVPLLGEAEPAWNLLYHLGGNGPWIPKRTDILNHTIDAPSGCRIEQVHMVGLDYIDEVGTLILTVSSPSCLDLETC